MPVHHLRMLDQHRANYNKQDTVLAQLLYHPDTAHSQCSQLVLFIYKYATFPVDLSD